MAQTATKRRDDAPVFDAEEIAILDRLKQLTESARSTRRVIATQELQVSQTNTGTFEDLLKDATEFGKRRGQGSDAQVQFALKIFGSAFHGKVDLTPNKHGDGIDDAQFITERYIKAAADSTIFDAKAQPVRTQASKFRACIKGGGWTKGGAGEPLSTANNLMNIWTKLRADPTQAPRLDDAMNAFLKFNRTLIKRDQLPSDAELKSFCYKTDPNLASPEEILVGLRKQLVNLHDGKASKGTAQLKNADTGAVLTALNTAISNLVAKRTKGSAPKAA